MLDVHPPHETTHTWKDFFLHIATICVGLLIAVALEQTVEAIHQARERSALRRELQTECAQIALDAQRVETSMKLEVQWHEQVELLLLETSRKKEPIAAMPPFPGRDFDVPGNPVYNAAKSSNKLGLLTQEEAQSYGEMEAVLNDLRLTYEQHADAVIAEQQTLRALPVSIPSMGTALTNLRMSRTFAFQQLNGMTLPADEMKAMYASMVRLQGEGARLLYWSRQARGAAVAIQSGERDLRKLQLAERQFDNLP